VVWDAVDIGGVKNVESAHDGNNAGAVLGLVVLNIQGLCRKTLGHFSIPSSLATLLPGPDDMLPIGCRLPGKNGNPKIASPIIAPASIA